MVHCNTEEDESLTVLKGETRPDNTRMLGKFICTICINQEA